MPRTLLAFGAALLFFAPSSAAQTPAPLDSTDFAFHGVRLGLDSTAVRAAFGGPAEIRHEPNPLEPGGEFVYWRYRDVEILFGKGMTVLGCELKSRRAETRRGLHLGDRASRVKELYGVEAADLTSTLPGPHIEIEFDHGEVSYLYLGYHVD